MSSFDPIGEIKCIRRRQLWFAAGVVCVFILSVMWLRSGAHGVTYALQCGHRESLFDRLQGRAHNCDRLRAAAALSSLWVAAEGYKLEEGDYPSSLSLLYKKGLLTTTFGHEYESKFRVALEPNRTFAAFLPDGTIVRFVPPSHTMIQTRTNVIQFDAGSPTAP